MKSLNSSTFVCPFEYGKFGKEGEKDKKFKSRERKELFR